MPGARTQIQDAATWSFVDAEFEREICPRPKPKGNIEIFEWANRMKILQLIPVSLLQFSKTLAINACAGTIENFDAFGVGGISNMQSANVGNPLIQGSEHIISS